MFGAFIRSVRESRGLSQLQLAAVSGIDQPNISAIERDRRMPSAETLNRLLVACGYELGAVTAGRTIYAPLPSAGWFPDEDIPPRLPDDPADEAPTVTPTTPIADRVGVITAVLEASTPR